MDMKKFLRTDGVAVLKIVIGCFLYSLSVVWFIDPVHIIPGSITGIGVVVKAVTGFPIGMLNFIINVPLVIIGTIILGKRILIYTGLTVFLNSVMMDGFAFMQPFTEDVLLASIFGGVLMGIGLGMILDGGGSTGGTTLVGKLVALKFPSLPMGTILLIGDFIIIMCGSLVLRDWDMLLYSLIDLYVCVIFIDIMMYGYKKQSVTLILTEKGREIGNAAETAKLGRISDVDDRHLTLVSRKKAVDKLQKLIVKEDADAVIESIEAGYSFGNIFKTTV